MKGPNDERPRLTVAMIVRNAAVEVGATLDSIRGIADEIAILDTGSTDDTIARARQAGATVHRQPWNDDFSAARNACLAKTSGDWILWLDAGEKLSEADAQRLRQFIDNAADGLTAYLLPIVLPAAPGQISGEQILQVRLHPLEEGVAFAGRVRESLDESLAASGMSLTPLDIAIHRGPRDHEPALKADRAQRNIRLADLALAEHGPAAAMHNCLGEALQNLGDPLRAAQQYQQALRLAPSKSRDQIEAYYGLLTCLNGSGPDQIAQPADRITAQPVDRITAQLALCMEALERFPLDAQLLVALGGYLQSQQQPQLAVRAFDVAFRHGQIEPRIWHLPEIREIAASCAATLHVQLGAEQDARTLLEAATRTLPGSLRLAKQLADLNARRKPQLALRIDDTQPSAAPATPAAPPARAGR